MQGVIDHDALFHTLNLFVENATSDFGEKKVVMEKNTQRKILTCKSLSLSLQWRIHLVLQQLK